MSSFEITRPRTVSRTRAVLPALLTLAGLTLPGPADAEPEVSDTYRVLATSRTSTMEEELNQAAADGYRLDMIMGGETAFGGKEVVAIASRHSGPGRFAYRLLATSKTSTMQSELHDAAAEGFHYRDQTVFDTALSVCF